jgi:cysteine-rich repeat protein
MHPRRALPGLALALAVASAALATDHPIGGDSLALKDPMSGAAGRKVKFKATHDTAIDPSMAGDPRSLGATLEIAGENAGDGSTGPLMLGTMLWTGLGKPAGSKGYKYFDKARTNGVRKVAFRPGAKGGVLTVSGGGSGWPYQIAQAQGPIDVHFTIGTDVYCAKFIGFAANEAGRVSAKGATAPPDCSLPPPPTCGDGIIESGEECDDANTMSGDGCSSTCQLENTSALCAGVPTVSGTSIASVRIASGLAHPVYVTAPTLDPNRLFIVEQPGRIRLVKNGALQGTAFLDIASEVESNGSEQGLLSLAFDPDFESSGFFYVNYTSKMNGSIGDGDTVVARFHANPTSDQADSMSEMLVFTVAQPFSNHNGGLNHFGPDGMLYVGLGDGGSGGDPNGNGQSDASNLGKLLRVDVSTLPATPTHFAKGLRNPWRWTFDRATSDLYIADVGQNLFEEINFVPAPVASGFNYGWNIMEGRHCFNTLDFGTPLPTCTMTGFTLPVLEYCHSTGENGCVAPENAHPTGCSITGGFVYRGCRMPDLRGRYFYSDFCSAFIRSFKGVSGGDAQDVQDHTTALAPGGGLSIDAVSSFGEDARGELYITDLGSGSDGEVYQIVPGP